MASDNEASCESDPNFAVICAFMEKFGVVCGLTNFDFLVLQEMLENTQEVSQELIDLHIKLLRKSKKSVSNERWEKAIIKFCHGFCIQDAWEIERFGYKKARLSSKLRVLKELLEMQFDFNAKFKSKINQMSAEELRSQPLGKDKFGHVYWFHSDSNCQIRVYKEDPDEETWTLIARDREGLVSLINELSDGDSKVSSESTINEDSNSLAEKPIIDTGQIESSSSDSKKSLEESENSDESKKADFETKVQPDDEETNQPRELKRLRESDDEEEKPSKKSKIEDTDSEPKTEEVGDAVEEPIMLVKGQGAGCENEGVNTESPIVGEEIEEPVVFFLGAGNGEECQTGNEDKSPKKPEAADDNTQGDKVLSTVKKSEACNNLSINDKSDSKNCVSNPNDGSSEEVPTSPVKNPYKLGTIIDTKTDNKFFNLVKSPTKKSRWDVETLTKPEDAETVVTGKVKELVGKWEQIGDEKSTCEETEVEVAVPKKTMFFFGPGCLQFKPTVSPVPCSATVGFGKVPQIETGFDAKKTASDSGNDGRELIPSNTKGDIGYRISEDKTIEIAENPRTSTILEKEESIDKKEVVSNKTFDFADGTGSVENRTTHSAHETIKSEDDVTPVDANTGLDEKSAVKTERSVVSNKIAAANRTSLDSNISGSREIPKVAQIEEETKDQTEAVVNVETLTTDKKQHSFSPTAKSDKENRTEDAIPLKSETVGSSDVAKLDNKDSEETNDSTLPSSTIVENKPSVEAKSTFSKSEIIPAERLAKLEDEVATDSDGKCDLGLVKESKEIKVADSGSRPVHSTNLLKSSTIDQKDAIETDLPRGSVPGKEDSVVLKKSFKSIDEVDRGVTVLETDKSRSELVPVIEKECVKKYAYTLGDDTTKKEPSSVDKKDGVKTTTDLVDDKSLNLKDSDDKINLNANHIPDPLNLEEGSQDKDAEMSSGAKSLCPIKDSKASVTYLQSVRPEINEPVASRDIKVADSKSHQKPLSSLQEKPVDLQLVVDRTKSADVEEKPVVIETIPERQPADSELPRVDSCLSMRPKMNDPPITEESAKDFRSPLKPESSASAPKISEPPQDSIGSQILEKKSLKTQLSTKTITSVPEDVTLSSDKDEKSKTLPTGSQISELKSVDSRSTTFKFEEKKHDVLQPSSSAALEESSSDFRQKSIESQASDHKSVDYQLSPRLKKIDSQLPKSTEQKSSHLNAEPKQVDLKLSSASVDVKPLNQKLVEVMDSVESKPVALNLSAVVEKTSVDSQLLVKQTIEFSERSSEKKAQSQIRDLKSKVVESKPTTESIPSDPQSSVKAKTTVPPSLENAQGLQSQKGCEIKEVDPQASVDPKSVNAKVSTKLSTNVQETVKPEPTVPEEKLLGSQTSKTSKVTTENIFDDPRQSVKPKPADVQSCSLDLSIGSRTSKLNEAKSVDSHFPLDLKLTDSKVSTEVILPAQESVKPIVTQTSIEVQSQKTTDPDLNKNPKSGDLQSSRAKIGSKTIVEEKTTNSQLSVKSQLIDSQPSRTTLGSQAQVSTDIKLFPEPKQGDTQLSDKQKPSVSQKFFEKKPLDSKLPTESKPVDSHLVVPPRATDPKVAVAKKSIDSELLTKPKPIVKSSVDLQKSVEPKLSKETKPVDSTLLPESSSTEPKVPVEKKTVAIQSPVDKKPVGSHVSLRSVRAVGPKVIIERLDVSEKVSNLQKSVGKAVDYRSAETPTAEPNLSGSKTAIEKSVEPKAADSSRTENKSIASSTEQQSKNSKLSLESKAGDTPRSLRSKRIEKKSTDSQTSTENKLIDSKLTQQATIPEVAVELKASKSQPIGEKLKSTDASTSKLQETEGPKETVAKVDEPVPKESKTVSTKLTKSIADDKEKSSSEEVPPKKPGPKQRRKSANIIEVEEKKPRVATRRSMRSSKSEVELSETKVRGAVKASETDPKVSEATTVSDVRTVDITEVKVMLTQVKPDVRVEKLQEPEKEKETEKGKKSKIGEQVAPRRGRSRGVPSADKEEPEGDGSKKIKLSGDTKAEEATKEVRTIKKTRNRFKEAKDTRVAVVILENTAVKTDSKTTGKQIEKPEPESTKVEVEVIPEDSTIEEIEKKTEESSKSETSPEASKVVEVKPEESSEITETQQDETKEDAGDSEVEEVEIVSKPVDPIMVDSSSNSCDIVEGPDNDPLETSDQDSKDSEDAKPTMSLSTFSMDFNESPMSTPPNAKRGLRKRGRESPQSVEDTGATAGKRIKMRGKRSVDVKLRKSIEEQKKQELASSDDDNKQEQDRKIEKKADKHDKKSTSDSEPETPKTEVPKKVARESSNKNKRLLSNLGITLDQQSEMSGISGVRQSRRIAQLKIREEAERRKLEEEMSLHIDEHHKKKKKSKKSEDKDYKTEKRKVDVEDDEDESEEKVEKKKKKKKHRDPRKLFDMYNPWRSSSDSSSSAAEEDEEEIVDEEEDDDRLQYVSDHEFSPESDMEGDGEAQPLKRARTARKESEDEEVDDCPCQKCQKSDHPEWILLCDRCDNGWHCSCLRPPLLVIPEGDWFCPPCQHIRLLQKLQEKLHDYDKRLSKKEIEDRRKERLAYVGISLNNVLPAKELDHVKEPKRRNSRQEDSSSEESESESGSESGESESDSDEPIYQLRQRRQAHSYRFNDYDDLINSAIQDEMEAVKGAGNQGRGKDIATIVNAEKEEEEWKKGEVVEGEEPPPEGPEPLPRVVPEDTEARPLIEDEDAVKKRLIGQRKKHRKLNALDVSSAEDDEDSDFKGTSSESEEEFDDDLGSEDSDDLDSTRRRKNHDPVRRSTRARTSRYDADFIDDEDSDDEAPRKRKKRSIWDESESEESDKSWGRRRRRPAARKPATTPKKKKSKKKKKNDDDSDAEVYRKKKPKIKFGLDDDDEGPGRRTRGKKINYIDALGSDSEEDRVKRPPPRIESEEEYVANEEDELDEDDKVTDEDESGEDGVPKPPKVQIQSFTDERFTQALPEGVPTPKNPFGRPGHLDDIDSLEQMNRNLEEMDENEIGKMMEEEDYANKQLQLVALQIEREKKRKEREAKKLETIPPMLEQELPKKRGRKPKGHFQFPPTMQDPIVGNVDGLLNAENNDELSEPPGVSLPLFAELAATNESLDDPKKRRGRGRGKKSLEEAVAVLGSVRQQEAIQSSPFMPGQESNIEIAAPPQPFSQSQPTPSVITRMLQSKPGQPGYPVGTIRPKQFAAMPEREEDGGANLPPTAGPHHSMSPHHAPPGQYIQGGMRPQMSSPYRQLPPNMNHYPRSGPPPPHQIRNPVPQNMPPHIYHAHRTLDPSPSGGSAMNMSGHSSPSRVSSPAAGSPGPNKTDTPPPPYSRPPVSRFPMVNNPTPMTTAAPRHIHMHMQPPRPNMSPYHPNIPPSYHYGAFPQPPMGGAEDAMPPTVYQNSPYSEPFNEGQVNQSENSNSKSFDEESGGEFGGLVSYFSSQREDDLES